MTVFWIVMLIVGCVFTYCLGMVSMHAISNATTKWDSEDSWVVGGFWPVTLLFWACWMLTHKLPGKMSEWKVNRETKKKLEEESKRNKYNTINIPKGDISTSKEYRELGRIAGELRDKLTSYEISSDVPVTERNS